MSGFWSGRRVLVTGHTGFKGSWLCLWLSQLGADVVGYSDGVPSRPALFEAAAVERSVDSLVGDVRDREHLGRVVAEHRPEVVMHLAAQPLVRRSYVEPALTYETNVIGTVNLLEAIRAIESVRVVVVVTTDKVYEQVESKRHPEGDRLGGHDPYSSSKACAELVTSAYRSSYFEHGAAVATARAGNVIGGGDWGADRLLPDIVDALRQRRPLELRYPQAVRPWQHVLNPLDGYLVLAERLWDDRAAAAAWNFGPAVEDARPVEWVARRAAEHWGGKLEIRAPATPQPPEAPSLELDASRARASLGWQPRWDLDEGLAATVDWYRRFDAGEPARDLVLEQIDTFSRAVERPAVIR